MEQIKTEQNKTEQSLYYRLVHNGGLILKFRLFNHNKCTHC